MLERGEQPHPVCTFQDDFQEFEMIDDNEEEEEEEEGEEDEEEEGNALEAPPSPSASPIPSPGLEDTQKLRPTTLNLTAPGTQVGSMDGAGGGSGRAGGGSGRDDDSAGSGAAVRG